MKFAETYAEVKKFQGISARDVIRHAALNTISSISSISTDRNEWLTRNRIQFLYLHHFFKDEIERFKQLIGRLSATHHFISYSDAVTKITSGSIDKPYICFSSDDGFKNNLAAAKILNEYGISACFFICPAIIGENDTRVISAFCSTRLNFPPVEFLNWQEVSELQKLGHEIGGHTMNHVRIADIPESELTYEVGSCYTELQQRCGSIPHFAFPYGRFIHFNEQGKRAVFNSGFKTIASAERGCHITDKQKTINDKDLLIRRDHILLSWPWKHIEYFIAKNSRNASVSSNYFPSYADSDHNR